MMLFGRFGTLFKYDGVPVYVGDKLLTKRWMVWWWPVNWVAFAIGVPIVLVKMLLATRSENIEKDG